MRELPSSFRVFDQQQHPSRPTGDAKVAGELVIVAREESVEVVVVDPVHPFPESPSRPSVLVALAALAAGATSSCGTAVGMLLAGMSVLHDFQLPRRVVPR